MRSICQIAYSARGTTGLLCQLAKFVLIQSPRFEIERHASWYSQDPSGHGELF